MRIHLDTDLGSDTDDAGALAMALGTPGVEVTGVTTTIDPGGRRAGMVTRVLDRAGRRDVPVAAGAATSLTTAEMPGSIPDDARYWGGPIEPRPSPPGAALDLLAASLAAGATIVAIGPWTNLALLEITRPGSLTTGRVVTMGGFVDPAGAGLPDWGPDRDWNVTCDRWAAEIVARRAELTLVGLAATLQAHLRARDLGRLREAGRLGELLAHQAATYAADHNNDDLGRAHPGLPDDLVNFQHDALAVAVALGSPAVTTTEVCLDPVVDDDVLSFRRSPRGHLMRVADRVDGATFAEDWLAAVEAVAADATRPSKGAP